MSFQLSKGALKKMLDGSNVTDPILQIMQMKNIQNNMDGMTRYKVTLFDGDMTHTFGILATQKNNLVENDELKVNSVIRLEEYAANVLSKDPPKVVVILLNFEILGEMDKEESMDLQEKSKPIQNENIEPNVQKPNLSAKSFFNKKDSDIEKPAKTASNQSQSGVFNGHKIVGISGLNPYQNKWSIKARVTNKSPIRTYSNARGEGKLFNVELLDGSGEIKMAGFNEQCDKFYDLLQIDQVYFISRCQLKTANKQYSKLNNDYEMTMTSDTAIEQCEETAEDSVPHITLTILPLSDIAEKNANDYVDIIGIVKSFGETGSITVKATGKELIKREINVVDDSNCAVSCTLWGKQAEDFDGTDNPVILIKGGRVGDYMGRNISVGGNSVFQVNPDIPEAHKLRGWFDQGGSECEVRELSGQSGMGGGASSGGGTSSNWKSLDQIQSENLGMGDKADYFSSKATILYSRKDNSMYMACPGEGCNKKVIDQNDGTYRCEKCAKSYDEFKWRIIMSVNLADGTESTWATCFQDQAEMILGIKADELGDLKNSSSPKYDELFSECVFKEFNFKLRAKVETYNDERRVKVTVASCDPINYVQSGQRLLQSIKAYAKTV